MLTPEAAFLARWGPPFLKHEAQESVIVGDAKFGDANRDGVLETAEVDFKSSLDWSIIEIPWVWFGGHIVDTLQPRTAVHCQGHTVATPAKMSHVLPELEKTLQQEVIGHCRHD